MKDVRYENIIIIKRLNHVNRIYITQNKKKFKNA